MRRTWIVVVAVVVGCKDRHEEAAPPTVAAPSVVESAGSGSAALPPEIQQEAAKVAADEYATAKTAKGTVTIQRAWRSARGPKVAAGHAWVLLDVDFGDLALDTDDLELVDPDRDVSSAIGDVQRLDASGNLVAMGGGHAGENHFLLGFATESATKRAALRYWGEMLTNRPVEIAASGPEFAEAKREAVRHFAKGDRHVIVFEDHNQEDPPADLTNEVEFDGGKCVLHGILPVSASLAVVAPPVEAFAPHAFYAADFTCAKPPTTFGWTKQPIPAAEAWAVPAATVEAFEGRGQGVVTIDTGEGFPSVALRRDGSLVAIAPENHDIRLVDTTGKELGAIKRSGGKLTGLGFTPDGTKLWGVEDGGDVVVWDVASKKQVASRRLDPAPDMYAHAAMSSDGKWLVIDTPWTKPGATRVAWSGQLTVLAMPDLAVKGNAKVIDGNTGSIRGVALSADGKVVVCSTTEDDSRAVVLALPKLTQQVAIKSTTSRAATCAIGGDGKILVGTDGGEVEIYERGKKVSSAAANAGGVQVVATRPDGSFLTGGADGKVLDWRAGKAVEVFRQRYPVHEIAVEGDLVAARGPYDAAVLSGGKVAVWLQGSPTGPREMALASGVLVISELAIGAKSSRVRIWRAPK